MFIIILVKSGDFNMSHVFFAPVAAFVGGIIVLGILAAKGLFESANPVKYMMSCTAYFALMLWTLLITLSFFVPIIVGHDIKDTATGLYFVAGCLTGVLTLVLLVFVLNSPSTRTQACKG